jgi:hypothetical protein
MSFIEPEGKFKTVAKKNRASSSEEPAKAATPATPATPAKPLTPEERQSEMENMINYLAGSIVNLAGRVVELEGQIGRSESGVVLKCNAESSAWKPTMKSAEKYKVPQWAPWPLDSGFCQRCGYGWLRADSSDHFSLDRGSWETVMTRIYADWETGSKWAHMKDSYAMAESNVCQALVACGGIAAEHEERVASSMRQKLWKPDVVNDRRPYFIYQGGKKHKYITFGCIACQRATTLSPSSSTFYRDLVTWFP